MLTLFQSISGSEKAQQRYLESLVETAIELPWMGPICSGERGPDTGEYVSPDAALSLLSQFWRVKHE